MKLHKILFLGFLLFLPNFEIWASTTDTTKIYTSLEEALKEPLSVKKLQLKKQKLKEFPTEILQLENLEYLDLSNNKISEIPKGIGSLKHLRTLKLHKNAFLTFPEVLTNLDSLENLDLSRNPIDEVPEPISNLQNLKELVLWSTYVVKLPTNMSDMQSHLQLLDLRNIRLTREEQREILQLLPKIKIRMDKTCNCY